MAPRKEKKEEASTEEVKGKEPKSPKKETKPARSPKKVNEKKTEEKSKRSTKKDEKPKKPTKKVEKKAEKKTEEKKSKKPEAKGADKGLGKRASDVCEAIAVNMTEDDKWVSINKIKDHIYNYISETPVCGLHGYCKKGLEFLLEKKYIRQKKNSYAFTVSGLNKAKPDKIPKRKKIEHKVAEPVRAPIPEKRVFITLSGRVSNKVY